MGSVHLPPSSPCCGVVACDVRGRSAEGDTAAERSQEPLLLGRRGSGKMVYISNGQVLDSRSQSPWRLSFITDFFWGIAEFVVLFFRTLLQQDVKKRRGYGGSSDSRYDDGRGPPGNPPRRMGRINHLRGPNPPPMAGG
uniref:Selenoprotein K n=2 Tax=Suina TaxID=35497 RepID=A0A8D1Y3B7_PIG